MSTVTLIHVADARALVLAVFDELTPTLDGWETECGEPLYRRPE